MKNIKAILITLLMPAMLFGFGKLKVPGLEKAEPAASTAADAGSLQEDLVRDYLTANSSIQKGQALLLEAFGKKDEAAKQEQGQASLSGKASKDEVKMQIAITKAGEEAIAKSIEEGIVLTEEGKAKYKESLVTKTD